MGTKNSAKKKFKDYHVCCICGESFKGWGNNPYPLGSDDELCCNSCNSAMVIPARLKQLSIDRVFSEREQSSRSVKNAGE